MPNTELFARILSWLLTYAVHSSVLLGAVWLFLRLRTPRGLALRERLWKLALVGPLVTASLQLALGARPWLGHIEWSAAPSEHSAALAPSRSETATEPLRAANADEHVTGSASAPRLPRDERANERAPRRPRGPALLSASTPPEPDAEQPIAAPAERLSAPALVERATEETPTLTPAAGPSFPKQPARAELAPASTTTRVSAPPSWPGLLLLAWAGLGLLGILGVSCSFVALWRRLAGRETLREGPLVETLEALRLRARLRRRVRLSISSRVAAPFSTGVLFPEICLPRAVVSGLTPAQQEVLLAHELGHLLRRDPFWFTAGYVLERVFFFQPLNRVARHELSELAELACDDWAVRWTGSRLALASCLTEVAGWLVEEPRRQLALPGLTAPRSPLGRRITRLLDDRRSPTLEPGARSWPLYAFSALGLTVAAVPGISAASATSARDKAEPGELALDSALESARDTLGFLPETVLVEPLATVPDEPAFEALPLEHMRLELEARLVELESELDALHVELVRRDLDARFADDLAAIEERMHTLREQQARASTLLDELARPNTPAPAWR